MHAKDWEGPCVVLAIGSIWWQDQCTQFGITKQGLKLVFNYLEKSH